MRLATVDIGTNSTRMLIADFDGVRLMPVFKTGKVTRLGEGVEESGFLKREAVERTLEVLRDFVKIMKRYDVAESIAATTEAARIAKNSEEFLSAVRNLGINVILLPDDEEAKLVFNANILHFRPKARAATVDLGGGSTEIVFGTVNSVQFYESLKFGIVFLTEKFLKSDPPKQEELEALESFLREQLKGVFYKAGTAEEVFAVGGTATSVVAMQERMKVYDTAKVHGYKLSRSVINLWYERLKAMSVEQRRKIVGLEKARADVIVSGLAFFRVFCELFDLKEITVSELGLLFGLAVKLIRDKFGVYPQVIAPKIVQKG